MSLKVYKITFCDFGISANDNELSLRSTCTKYSVYEFWNNNLFIVQR